MEHIEAFKTKDGKIFESQRDAEKHEKDMYFNQWYWDNTLYGDLAGSKVDCAYLKEYILEHADMFRTLLDIQADH